MECFFTIELTSCQAKLLNLEKRASSPQNMVTLIDSLINYDHKNMPNDEKIINFFKGVFG